MFLSHKKCTGADQRLDQRRNLIRLLEDRPVSCLSLARKTTKLASDREISQSTAAFSPPPSFVVKSAQGETFVLHKTLALFFNSQFITGFDRKYWNAVRRCAVVEVDLSSLFCLSKDR